MPITPLLLCPVAHRNDLGQEINEGNKTRVSCDLRFVSSRAPIDIRCGKCHAGYVPVSESPVEMLAREYYHINPKG